MNDRTRFDAFTDPTAPAEEADSSFGFERWASMLGIGEKAVLTTTETASVLRVSEKSVREGIKIGAIPCIRLGRRILVPVPTLLPSLIEGSLG